MRLRRPLLVLRPLFLPRDRNNAEFWISHMLIVGSTILGVYLAASQGYGVAVAFETVRADRQSYYLQTALRSELRENLNHIEKWRTQFETVSRAMFRGRRIEIRLESHVWTSMATSDAAYEVPPVVLNGIRRFYRQGSANLAKMTETEIKGKRIPNLEQMREDAAYVRAKVIPALDRNIAVLSRRLASANVSLGGSN